MKAAVYFGPKDIRTVDVDDPKITEPHQILVKVRATSICGSDLHIWRGTLDQAMGKGHSTLGHELSGEVIETGAEVGRFVKGDRVSMGYSASCGDCYQCRHHNTAHCQVTKSAVYGFGVGFGDLNGTQAEYMVIPHADAHTLKIDEALTDAQALTLSCNLPTAVLANKLVDVQIGESLVIVGLGPTGMMALDLATKRGPGKVFAFDPVAHRREAARARYGIEVFEPGEAGVEAVKAATGGRGADKVIEMVGTGESLDLSFSLIRAGGTMAGLGVFTDMAHPVNLLDVFFRDITLHMRGFASVWPEMWNAQRLITEGKITLTEMFTHNFSLDQAGDAYRVFGERLDNVEKVLIRP